MIDAVLLFGALNVCFEFVLLSMLTPRLRLRMMARTYAPYCATACSSAPARCFCSCRSSSFSSKPHSSFCNR